jgi:FkbM family methyltransferase
MDKEHYIILVDIGSSGGIDKRWRNIENLKSILFEPDYKEFEKLKLVYKDVYNFAISDKNEECALYITSDVSTCSLLKPNIKFLKKFIDFERFNIIKNIEISTKTLDYVYNEYKIANKPNFIKIDTQGAELKILEGSKDTLNYELLGADIEVYFKEVYKEVPSFSNINNFLETFDLIPYDMNQKYWKNIYEKELDNFKGELIWADVLYLKKPEKVIEYHTKENRLCNKAIDIGMIYGMFGYSLEILNLMIEKDLINEKESFYYKNKIREKSKSSRIGNFRLFSRFAYFLNYLFLYDDKGRFEYSHTLGSEKWNKIYI